MTIFLSCLLFSKIMEIYKVIEIQEIQELIESTEAIIDFDRVLLIEL
jgi:hypothetical protein